MSLKAQVCERRMNEMKQSVLRGLLPALSLALLLGLSACGTPTAEPSQSPSPTQTAQPSPSQSPSVDPDQSESPSQSETPSESPSQAPAAGTVRLAFLNGPTGMGAAKLLDDIDSGALTGYTCEVAADNNEVVNLLTHGDVDIAALATNVALNLYNKNESIQMLALNTRGVLYILEGKGTDTIQSVADLQGKTLYAFGEGANPQYILGNLLAQSGLDEESVNIQWTTPEEATQALLSGEADAAMLPVPAATAAIAKGQGQVRQAVDLSAAWEEAYGSMGSGLYMGCLVVRRDFAAEHPQAVADFLDAYAASMDFVTGDPAAAAPLAEAHGLAPSAAIAEKAIPACNLCFLTGDGIAEAVTPYYEALFRADPAAIGGSLPDDGFYYVP